MTDTKRSSTEQLFLKHKKIIIIIVALLGGFVASYPDLRSIYDDHQLSHAASVSSKKFGEVTGSTPDGKTYSLSVPPDFRELSEKESPERVVHTKKYRSITLASISLEAYKLSDEEILDKPTTFKLAKENSSDYVKEFKARNGFRYTIFDKKFAETSTDRLRINYRDTHYEDHKYDTSGTLILLYKDRYMYTMIVQSRQVYDKNNPSFKREVIDNFNVY